MAQVLEQHQVAQLLNIPVDAAWKISARGDDGLVLMSILDSNKNHSLMRYNGMILDLKRNVVVCPPINEMNCKYISSTVPMLNERVTMKLDSNTTYSLPLSDVKFYRGHDGGILRVFRHQGKTHYATHNNLRAAVSRWGPSPTFLEIFTELGGCDPYEKGAPEDVVFYFLLVHPTLQAVSHEDIGTGRLILLKTSGDLKSFDPILLGWKEDSQITLEDANNILAGNGDFDERLSGADNVIVVHQSVTINVTSPAYEWRFNMRDNDSNVVHRLYSALSDSYMTGKYKVTADKYLAKYIPLVVVPMSMLKENRMWTKCDGAAVVQKLYTRQYNIFMNIIYAMPYCVRPQLIQAFESFGKNKKQLVAWLSDETFSLADLKKDPLNNANALKRIEQIVSEASDRCEINGRSFNENIGSLLEHERGDSLYRMVKLMQNKTKA